uniref:Peptidase A1 domain-containing protein n=1 Tax=Kalanchoe fedtschenkoi TaxID=63787 RepID=A0A7N0TUU6_KALFE
MGSRSLLLVMAILGLFVLPILSTSRLDLMKRKKVSKGFRVELKHVDAGKNMTKFEKLQHAMKRGRHRLQKLNSMAITTGQIETPVHVGNGEFLMSLSIGTPAQSYQAIMDTGSDLIWTQCKPCKQCFDQPTPIFDPTQSSTFSKLPCSSQLCKALSSSTCSGECEYAYSYGDYSSTQGVLASETFSFGDEKVAKIGFGCGEDNEGSGFSQGSGLVGLGRGPLSLVSQLGEPKFSYCLVSIDSSKGSSSLLMGSLAKINDTKEDGSMVTTPLIKNPSQPSFYYLGLQGITVGATRLPIKESTFDLQEDGTGGMIIDSGTTITYLEQSAFDELKSEFISQTQLSVDDSGSTGLDLCFKLPAGADQVQVPKLKFHFEGGDLDLPGENYMIGDSGLGVVCLAMGSSSGMSIFGNVQQQNILVLHDLDKETVSFVPTQCDRV